jgi:arylsulfatase
MLEKTAPTETTRPNVLLILVDDMGFSDIGCYGAEIRTPNLDLLAAGGLRFSQAYNCARCCPTRAALLTGVYPHQAGIGHMVQNLGLPAYQGYLRDDCATLAEALRPAGYLSGLSGKWHAGGFFDRSPTGRADWNLNDPQRPLPTHRGFDRFYGNPAGGGSYFNVAPLVAQDRIIEVPEGFYTTDNYTAAALQMMEEAVRAGRPFFVHLCYNAPHWPLHALPEDIEKYRGKYLRGWDRVRAARHEQLKASGLLEPGWELSPRDAEAPSWEETPNREWEDARMAVYAAALDRVDQNLGRILKQLSAWGALENTLIFFLSDNGGSAEFLAENGRKEREMPFTRDGRPVRIGNIPGLAPGGPETFMSYGLPWANASNSPFRRFKSWVHEGGIATPLIAYWKGRIAAGGLSHEPLHVIDLAATILELCGGRYPREHRGCAVQPLEGESFSPSLFGGRWSRRQPIFWEHMGNRAVRHGPWKLVNARPGPWELYNLDDDRTELRDLAARHPGKVKEMEAEYQDWAARCGARPWEEVQEHRRLRPSSQGSGGST